MATELVDATKLDACCTAEANAIRAKTGSSAQIAYDWANSKGFADAIAAISGGGSSGILTFDFTQSLYDQETGTFGFVLSNATQNSSGLHLGASNAYASLSNINLYDHVIEVYVDTTDKQFGNNHGRFIMSEYDSGLICRSGSSWEVYTGNAWAAPATPITDLDYFENSIIRIEYPSSGQNVAIYKNDTQIFASVQFGSANFYKQLWLGSNGTAYYNATITKCVIYTNDAYALKVLLGG